MINMEYTARKVQNKKRISNKLIRSLIIILILFCAAVSFLGILLFSIYVDSNIEFNLFLAMIADVFILVGIGTFFVFRIAIPMVNIESVLDNIENGELENYETFDTINMSKNIYVKDRLNILLVAIKNAADREYSAQILQDQAELKALQSQINPHFLYNTLEVIRSKALIENVEDIAKMTKALATLFRYCISKQGDMVTLEEELNNLDNYLFIQQYRFRNKYIIETTYEKNEGILSLLLPKLTIQPIVENAFVHGLEAKISKGIIQINIRVTETLLIIRISDNGIGIKEEKLIELNQALEGIKETELENTSNSVGIALTNVNKRIKICFGEHYGITVYSTYGLGTDVELIAPKITTDNGNKYGKRISQA